MKKLNRNTIAIKFKETFTLTKENQSQDLRFWGFIALSLGATAFLIQYNSEPPKADKPHETIAMDTFIPKGQTLIPIQVTNYESLDHVIGKYGVVDLFTTPLNPSEKAKRVAFAVKLVRSPKSPRHFNVLLPTTEAHRIVGHHGEFTVSVRNPKIVGTKFVNRKEKAAKRRIVFESE